MSLLARGLRRIVRLVPEKRKTSSPAELQTEQIGPASAEQVDASPRPYSEARTIAARALRNDSWDVTNFSVNLGVAPCNHTCLFCPQSVRKPKKARWLELELLEKVLNEIPEEGIQIGLSSYSETIGAPNLLDAVRLMKRVRPKLRIAIASNGTLFREELFSSLMDAGLDHYSFSFDAATRSDYAKLMQADDFEKATRNLERLVELRRLKGSKMMITTHIMAFEGRERDFEAFKREWEGKIDFVQWRQVGNWGGDNWGLDKRLAEAGFNPTYKTPAKRYPCFSIFHHFKLQWDGYYYPCVAAVPDYQKDLENHCVPNLGHAAEITWQQAWQNLAEMRTAHLEGRWDAYDACRSCNIWGLYDDIWTAPPEDSLGGRFRVEE